VKRRTILDWALLVLIAAYGCGLLVAAFVFRVFKGQ
jgi:hypothetical protein